MCFGSDKYEESTVISSGSRVRDSYSSKPNRGGLFSGCFGDDEVYVVRDPRYHSHRRYGSRQTYYPAQYYAQPPRVVYVGNPYHHGHDMPRGVYLGGVGMGYGGGRHGRASMPTNGARRSYYAAGVAAPAYSYAYQTMAPAVAVPVMPTTTYAVNAQVPMTTTTPVTTTYRAGANTRMNLQEENRILASRRGAYNPKFIKPADARPEDPFWCKERTGEWHLRSYYQIENECQPGAWLMDPELGNLTFHRH